MKPLIPQATPIIWALAYGALSTVIVMVISFIEGTLYEEHVFHVGNATLVQYPYIYNISTILDFSTLNPVVIFFLLKARNGFSQAFSHFKKTGSISLFNEIGIMFTSLAVGFSAMWFYFRGFVGRTFFTEAFAVASDGTATISLTGWAIFIFTAVFMSFIVLVIIEFGNYLLFIRSLDSSDFKFSLPPNVSADIKIAAEPCIYVTYVLATLFIVLAIFVFRDFHQFHIRESRRVWLFAPYILVCLIAFIPFWHLHKIMSSQKKDIVEASNSEIERGIISINDDPPGLYQRIDPDKLTQFVDKIEKLQSFYRSIPIWPVTSNVLIAPNISLIISTVALIYKIAESFHANIPK